MVEVDIINIIDGLFFVFLAILSSFTFKILGCPLQKLLANNLWARHLTYIAVVIFTTTFMSDGHINPLYHFIYAFCIYLFIIVFTKMTVAFTVLVFALLIILYIVHMYIKYFTYMSKHATKQDQNVYASYLARLEPATNILLILIICITLLGALKFGIHKHSQYGKKFSIIKYLFGTRLCIYDNV